MLTISESRHSRHVHVEPEEMAGRCKLAHAAKRYQIDKGLCFVEEPIEVRDRDVKKLKQSKIPIIKVHWNDENSLGNEKTR
nr:putative reverse transcriptase domain-containing protein [Tanacetum cinerariifolium]